MAWRIATASPAEEATNAPAGFLRMAAFQWVNPKGWLIGVAAVATFLDRRAGGALAQAAILAILFTLVALPSCLPWLAFGATLQRFDRTPRARRLLNGAMAALLAASTILLVWTRLWPRATSAPNSWWPIHTTGSGVTGLTDYPVLHPVRDNLRSACGHAIRRVGARSPFIDPSLSVMPPSYIAGAPPGTGSPSAAAPCWPTA
jgi:hypothetical protein